MMREYIASAWVLVAGVVIAGAIVAAPAFTLSLSKALAQEGDATKIQFPVAELGNCGSEGECKTYCDDPANITACVAFAEANGLMSREEAATARRFAQGGFKGPGGCTSKTSCESYCDDIAHIDACVSFAEANNIIPPQELAEAKKVQSAIARGVKPPACGNKRSCDTYCRLPANMKECIAFGEAAGFIQGKELEDARKMIAALDKGVTPPACNGKEECDVFCAEEANFPQCIAFAEAAGFMSKEELEMAKKTGGKGPGGCRGEECRTFCDNPTNQEVCFAFAKEHNLIPEEDLKRMEEGKVQMRQGLTQAPPQVQDCLKSALGEDQFQKLSSGQGFPSQDIGEKMRACFDQMPRPSGAFGEGGGPQGMPPQGSEGQFQPGPGMMNPGSQIMPQQAGPGGCKTPEECQSYCISNPDACKNFGPGPGGEGQFPRPPEGFIGSSETRVDFQHPCEGSDCPQMPGGFPPQFEQQFQDQYQQQFQRQYQQQYQEQYRQIMPPEGSAHPTDSFTPPSDGAFVPPPSGDFTAPPPEFQNAPPPTEPPPPSSFGPQALLGLFLEIFR